MNNSASSQNGSLVFRDLTQSAAKVGDIAGQGIKRIEKNFDRVTRKWPKKIEELQKSENSILKFFFSKDNIPKPAQKFLDIYEKVLTGVTVTLGIIPNAIGIGIYALDAFMKERMNKLRAEGKISNDQLTAMHEDEDTFIANHREIFQDNMFSEEVIKRVLPEFLIGLGDETLNERTYTIAGKENYTGVILAGKFTQTPAAKSLESLEAREYINIRSIALDSILKTKGLVAINVSDEVRRNAIKFALDHMIYGTPLPALGVNSIIDELGVAGTRLDINDLVGNYNSAQAMAEEYVGSILSANLLTNTSNAEVSSLVSLKTDEIRQYLNVPRGVAVPTLQGALSYLVNSYRTTGNFTTINARIAALPVAPAVNSEDWFLLEIYKLSNRNIENFFKDFLEKPKGYMNSASGILRSNYLSGFPGGVNGVALNQISLWLATLGNVNNPATLLTTWSDIIASHPQILPLFLHIAGIINTTLSSYLNIGPLVVTPGTPPSPQFLILLKGIFEGESLEVLRFNLIKETLQNAVPAPGNAQLVTNLPQYNYASQRGGSFSTDFFNTFLTKEGDRFPIKAFTLLHNIISKGATDPAFLRNFQNIDLDFLGSPARAGGNLNYLAMNTLDPTLLRNPAHFINAYNQLLKANDKLVAYERAKEKDAEETKKSNKNGIPGVITTNQMAIINGLVDAAGNPDKEPDFLFLLLAFNQDAGQPLNRTLGLLAPDMHISKRTNLDMLVGTNPSLNFFSSSENKTQAKQSNINRAQRAKVLDRDDMIEVYSFLGLPPFASRDQINEAVKHYKGFIKVADSVFAPIPRRTAGAVSLDYIINPNYVSVITPFARRRGSLDLKELLESDIFYAIERKLRSNPKAKSAAILGDLGSDDIRTRLSLGERSALRVLHRILPNSTFVALVDGKLNGTNGQPISAEELIVITTFYSDASAAKSSYIEMKEKVGKVQALVGGEGDDFSFLDVYEGAMGEYIFKDWSQGVNQVEQEYLRANGTKSHFFVLDVPEPMWGEKSKLLEYGKRQAERYKGVKSFFENSLTLPAANPRSIAQVATRLSSLSRGIGVLGTTFVDDELKSLLPSSPEDASEIDNVMYLFTVFCRENPGLLATKPLLISSFQAAVSGGNWALETLGIDTGTAAFDARAKAALQSKVRLVTSLIGRNTTFTGRLFNDFGTDFYSILNYIFYTFRNHGASSYGIENRTSAISSFMNATTAADMEALLRSRHTILSASGPTSPLTDIIVKADELSTSVEPVIKHNAAIKAVRNSKMIQIVEGNSGFVQDLKFSITRGSRGKSPQALRTSGFGLSKEA